TAPRDVLEFAAQRVAANPEPPTRLHLAAADMAERFLDCDAIDLGDQLVVESRVSGIESPANDGGDGGQIRLNPIVTHDGLVTAADTGVLADVRGPGTSVRSHDRSAAALRQ